MKRQPHVYLGRSLGYIAASMGVIVLAVWFLADAENTTTAVLAGTTVVLGGLIVAMSHKRSNL